MRRLAAGRGIHILNVVRAAQRGDGPDIFLTDGDDLADRVIAIAGRQPKGALDAVAGTATGRLARCLASNGTLLVYGHPSGDPCEIPSTPLTTKSLNLNGFPLRAAEANAGAARRVARYAELAARAIRHPEPIGALHGFGHLDAALAPHSAVQGKSVSVRSDLGRPPHL